MRIDEIESKLTSLNVPDIESEKHQEILRSTLLVPNKARSLNFLESIKHMSVIKKIAGGAVMAAVIMMVAFTFSIRDASNIAKADEVVSKAFTKAVALSPEQREKLSAKLNTDLLDSLAEAKQAADLTYLTKEEFQAEFAPPSLPDGGKGVMTFQFQPKDGVAAGGVSVGTGQPYALHVMKNVDDVQFEVSKPALGNIDVPGINVQEPVKYLKYTNKEGATVVLGIDENDLPVMKMMKLSEDKIKQLQQGTHIEGNIGTFNTSVSE